MKDPGKTYEITKLQLNQILRWAGDLYDTGTHMTYKYQNDHEGQTDEELICEGAQSICDKGYQGIYRMVNQVCTDDKLDGELE